MSNNIKDTTKELLQQGYTSSEINTLMKAKESNWVDEKLKNKNLSSEEIRRLENTREKTLLKHILSKSSPEARLLNNVDIIMDNIKPERKKVDIMSLYTTQETNESLRLNRVYNNILNSLNSKDKITVVKINGKNVLSDGNHRVNALLKMGITKTIVNYYDYDKHKDSIKL